MYNDPSTRNISDEISKMAQLNQFGQIYASLRHCDSGLYKGIEGSNMNNSDENSYNDQLQRNRILVDPFEEPHVEYYPLTDSQYTQTQNSALLGYCNRGLYNILEEPTEEYHTQAYIDHLHQDGILVDPFREPHVEYYLSTDSDYTQNQNSTSPGHCNRRLYNIIEEPEEEYNLSSDSDDTYTPTTLGHCDYEYYPSCIDNDTHSRASATLEYTNRILHVIIEEPDNEYYTSSDSEDAGTINALSNEDSCSSKTDDVYEHVSVKLGVLSHPWEMAFRNSEDAIWHVPRSAALQPEDQDMQDFFRIRDALMKFGVTEKEWKGKDFLQMAREMRALKNEGVMKMDFCSHLGRLITKEKGVQELNIENYHKTLNLLMRFSSSTISNEFLNMTMGIKSLHETDPLIKNFAWFKKLIEDSNRIQIRIDKFKYKGISDIIEDMQTLLELGLLNDEHLSKFEETAKQCGELAIERENQIRKIEDTLKDIERVLPSYETENKFNLGEKLDRLKLRIQLPGKYRKKVSSNRYKEELKSEKSERESKSKLCRSDHNTPLCVNCGWLYSWLKAFKKKGISVKVAENCTDRNFWHNKI